MVKHTKITLDLEAAEQALEAWACTGKDLPLSTIMQRGDDLSRVLRKAQGQSEPVAWMTDTRSVASLDEKEKGYVLKSAFNIPPYTTPAAQRKPLTDEEIDVLQKALEQPEQEPGEQYAKLAQHCAMLEHRLALIEQATCKRCGDGMVGSKLEGALCCDCANVREQPEQEPVALLKESDVLMMAATHGIEPGTKGLYGFYVDCISNTPTKVQPEHTKTLTCIWLPSDDDQMPGTFHTNCGQVWSFNDGGWKENGVRFCHACGGKVEAALGTKENR